MIEWIKFKSPKALVGFPMNDPVERQFPVYLPPDYDANAKKSYPVAFFLAGFSGRGSGYISDNSAFEVSLPTRWDRAIAEKRSRPFIAVFPDGTSKMGCSQYVNSPAFGNYMDYLCDELVPFIESKYPVTKNPKERILTGHSSGGFGALITGMIRPEVFKTICSSAGDTVYELSLMKNPAFAVAEIEKAGGLAGFIKEFLSLSTYANIAPSKFDTMLTLAMAPCYAPNTKSAPLYGDPFFDLKTGEIIPEIWEKYLAWDPVRMVEQYASNLKQLDYVLLEAGLQDEHGLHLGHRQLAKKFKTLGVSHDIVEYPGKHGGHHWRYEDRMIRLLNRLN
jgi:enterochelin esterase-like enzyme